MKRFFGYDDDTTFTSATPTKDESTGPRTVNGKVDNTSCVNIRESPSTTAKVLGVLQWGDSVEILGKENGFCKVSTPNGFFGYVVDKYVKEV